MITKEQVEELAESGFEQVCIWPGTLVVNNSSDQETPQQLLDKTSEEKIKDFKEFMKKQFGVRVEYLEEIKTNPDLDDSGRPIEGTGNRNDLFFTVHNNDIEKFAVPRLLCGIRWYEDVVSYNGHSYLYPQEILEKYEVRW